MILGFTGTRNGMTGRQLEQFIAFLREHRPVEFHHGDCVGADEQAHNIVRMIGFPVRIVVHPPTDSKLRAHCEGDEVRAPKQYIARNHDIVKECDTLAVAPRPGPETMRSGTWATCRYAKQIKRTCEMLKP